VIGPLAVLAAALVVVGALVPWRGRSVVRAVLLFAFLLAPPTAIALALALYGRTSFGTWLLFIPLTFAWLATIDMKYGLGARLARPPRPRLRSQNRNAVESATHIDDTSGPKS
jgi:hypothetical protein